MKTLFLSALILLCSYANAQSWNGIPISGSIEQAKINLRNKGYVFMKSESNVYLFNGKTNGIESEVLVLLTPITKQVSKFVIFLDKKNNWDDLKDQYLYYKDILNTKYGIGDSYEYFKNPYYEGDGYEMSAVRLEKCKYVTYWVNKVQNMSISCEISEYNQVKFTYENDTNMEIMKSEAQRKTSNVF